MKKFSFAKIASLVFVCAMLLCALAVTTLATDEPTVAIVSNNGYYGDKYQLMFAVNAPDGADVSATDSEGNDIGVAIFADDPNPVIDGVQCKAYIITEGVAAQALDEVVTLTVEYNGTVATKSYSFLQYIYERMYVSNIAEGAERDMFTALLALADAADVFIDKTPADQTLSNYKYVTVVGGTLDGDNTSGMFLPGATPFKNIEDTLDYDSATHHVEWDVSVDGAEVVRYDNDDIKTVTVNGNTTVTAVRVGNDCIHVWGAWVVTPATCVADGSQTRQCQNCPVTETETLDATGVHVYGDWKVTDEATCVADGSKTRTCEYCPKTETETIKATGEHNYVDGACSVCKQLKPALATFEFGDDANKTHTDGNTLGTSKTYTNGSYSLNLTNMANVYGPAYDNTGKSCIKLGTSSKTGSLTFTVPSDVNSVTIYVAKYKTNTSKITVNNTSYTLNCNSNDGAYDLIVVDTSTNKTVTLATVSGGVRCMINTIEFRD